MAFGLCLLLAATARSDERSDGLAGITAVHNPDSGVEVYNPKTGFSGEAPAAVPTISLSTPSAGEDGLSLLHHLRRARRSRRLDTQSHVSAFSQTTAKPRSIDRSSGSDWPTTRACLLRQFSSRHVPSQAAESWACLRASGCRWMPRRRI